MDYGTTERMTGGELPIILREAQEGSQEQEAHRASLSAEDASSSVDSIFTSRRRKWGSAALWLLFITVLSVAVVAVSQVMHTHGSFWSQSYKDTHITCI